LNHPLEPLAPHLALERVSSGRVLVIHGPNLQLLGQREVSIYGTTRLDAINENLLSVAQELGLSLEIHQSNHEGVLVDLIGNALGKIEALVINPGAYTHTSIALRDAISAVGVFAIEVHLSNIFAREAFRHTSYISGVCAGVISGLGPLGYSLALRSVAQHLRDKNNRANPI
jgi:3-dehydroquinate dehydratase II